MSEIIYKKIIELLDKENADYRILEHKAGGKCEDVSRIRGNKIEEANKALIVRAKNSVGKHYFLLALRADQKADFSKIGDYNDIHMCDPAKVEELTGCIVGSVPPFSFNEELKVIADPLLLKNEYFWFNAGLLDVSVYLKTEDYLRIVKPEIKSISIVKDIIWLLI